MFELMNPVLGYMVATLLLGAFLGWVIWGLGISRKNQKALASEVESLQASLDEVRKKRDFALVRIETLTMEKEILQQLPSE